MTYIIKPRADTAANWTSANPVLANNEMGIEKDTGKIKIGDGTTAWNTLTYLMTKASVGLSNVNNTADANKPISDFIKLTSGNNFVRVPTTGRYYSAAVSGGAFGNSALANGRMYLAPFIPAYDMPITDIALWVHAAVASTLAKGLVYSAHATTSMPDTLLKATADFDCSTIVTPIKSEAWVTTLTAGTIYWIGCTVSGGANLKNIPIASCPNLGANTGTSGSMFTAIQRTITYASPPSTFNYTSADDASVAPPALLLKAA